MEISNLVWPSSDFVDIDQIIEVKMLWFNQKLSLEEHLLGFSQPKNGPCGVLSGVQALMMKHFLFDADLVESTGVTTATAATVLLEADAVAQICCKEALARGLATALWRAATIRLEHKIGLASYNEQATNPEMVAGSPGPCLVLPASGQFTDSIAHSEVDFRVVRLSSHSLNGLQGLVRKYLDFLTVEGGIILFLYSLVLSRGNVAIRQDLNDPYGTARFILDGWGFCGQALVNLLIGGTATSDVSGVVEYTPAGAGSASAAPTVTDDLPIIDVIEVISRQQIKGRPGVYEYEVSFRREPGSAVPPPRGDEKWRCLACTVKVPTNWSAWNDTSATHCKECGLSLGECGRCIWVPFEQLSASARREVETRYGKSAAVASSTPAAALPRTYHMQSEQIGFLTTEAPVGPHLQNPQFPIWVVHGGSHYTVLFCADPNFTHTEDERMLALDKTPSPVEFFHFNGLPPGGPRMARMTCSWDPPIDHSMLSGDLEVPDKPLDVDRIITRRQTDDGDWEYEVVAIATAPHAELLLPSAPRSSHPTADMYEADIYSAPRASPSWRCLSCTTSPEQVWSAVNPAASSICKECNRPLSETGRCLWLRYPRLPFGKQRQVDRDYAPAILQVIQTKYAGVFLDFFGQPAPSI